MTPIDAETADLQPPSHTSGPTTALPTSPERPGCASPAVSAGGALDRCSATAGVGCGSVIER
jgi:hypothetical protein